MSGFMIPGVDVAFGADIDTTDGLDIAVGAELDITTRDHQKPNRDQLIERYAPRIMRYPIGVNAPNNQTTWSQITDSPALGRRLEIKRFYLDLSLILAAGIPAAEPANVTVYLVASDGSEQTIANSLSGINILAKYTALPAQDKWGSDEAVVNHPENLFVVVGNASGAAITLAGNLAVVDFANDEFREPQMIQSILNTFNGK